MIDFVQKVIKYVTKKSNRKSNRSLAWSLQSLSITFIYQQFFWIFLRCIFFYFQAYTWMFHYQHGNIIQTR